MSERTGIIVGIENGMAAIRVERQHACSDCRARSVCGAGRAAETLVHVPMLDAAVGDRVQLHMPDGQLAKAALQAYLLPAVSTLLGALLLADAGDLAAVAGAAVGLGIGLIAMRRMGRGCAQPAVLPASTFEKLSGGAS